MEKFFDSQNAPKKNPDINPIDKIPKPFEITLNQKCKLENCSTEKKEKNKKPNYSIGNDQGENLSSNISNISFDDTESGEHKFKKKNVTWKDSESLVEKIEYNPMDAPFEI